MRVSPKPRRSAQATLAAAALAASLAVSLGAAGPARADTAAAPTPPRITVSAEGHVAAVPDMAQLTIGVTSTDETATAALSANSAQMSVVLERLSAAGVEPRDLQTQGLALNPNWTSYDSSAGGQKIDGYTAQNGLSVRLRDLDRLGAVIDAAVADGANTLNGLVFGTSNEAALMDEARRAAVATATARAALLAEAAGVKLGPIVSISEGGAMAQPMPMLRATMDAAPAPMPVAGGELEITATVTIEWALVE